MATLRPLRCVCNFCQIHCSTARRRVPKALRNFVQTNLSIKQEDSAETILSSTPHRKLNGVDWHELQERRLSTADSRFFLSLKGKLYGGTIDRVSTLTDAFSGISARANTSQEKPAQKISFKEKNWAGSNLIHFFAVVFAGSASASNFALNAVNHSSA